MGLRVAELETLFTANTDQIEKADRLLKQTADRAEKPIKLDADAKGVLGSLDRVEKEAKKLVSADTIVKLDADISRAQGQLDKAVVKLEDLQVRAEGGLDVTADTKRAEAQIQKLERSLAGLKKSRAAFDIDADGQKALAELSKVEAAEKRLVSADVVAKVDADISYAQKNVTRIQAQLEVLRSMTPSPKVLVDITRAEGQLDTAQRRLDQLSSARATMKVDADTSGAESSLKQVDGVAEKAGSDSGRSFTGALDAATRGAGEKVGEAVGGDIEGTLIQALAAIPVAGGIVIAGVAIGKAITGAIQDGLNVEKSMDRLAALTGLGDGDAQRIARAAGEAYANTFGSSIESNMDVARLALQFQLIDPKATTRDAQEVVQGLAGIADVLDEDVRPTAVAVTQLLRTGLAKSSKEAFDILAAGARNGVNTAEDMLDTFTEYPVVLARLGLSGAESLGLISQALKAGARNSDVAADALKEFQIRATDGSKLSAQGFEQLGLSAEDMTAKIAAGGDSAREGLGQVLTKLREIEDPVVRNAAAVALFGTKAEDMGASLFAMDLSSAVDQLDGVTGAAKRMFDTMSSNDASKIERAQRNIEVAVQGIQGALAAAFSEPLQDFADWVSANRGPLTQFLL
ncbi:phage tail tape measure protein, partial [uncultured Microbacterium sp.]|uniref:phage tail tape measure protein n=1 Tax=uncultured Microbacterium sp. TaxID=191216 RepID=UPI0025D7184B